MYKRYQEAGDDYQPVEPVSPPPSEPEKSSPPSPPSGGILRELLGKLGGGQDEKNAGISGIFKGFKPEELDKGDLLLLLILLCLFWESEDEEWLIILGLMIFLG